MPQPPPPPPPPSSPPPRTQNQEGPPLPHLTSALREDNRILLEEILRLDPSNNNDNNNNNDDTNEISFENDVTHKQRLVFSDEDMRLLILRHVLGDESSRSIPSMKKKKKKKKNKKQSKKKQTEEEEEEEYIPPGLGIVGTRILTKSPPKNRTSTTFAATTTSSSSSSSRDEIRPNPTGDGAEVVTLLEQQQQYFQDSRDGTDGAKIIVYIIRPTPLDIRLVSSYIHNSSNNNTTTKKHHRIVLIPHLTSMIERILVDERLVSNNNTTTTSTDGNKITIHTCPIDFVPLDEDVWTFGQNVNLMKEVDVEGCRGGWSDGLGGIGRGLLRIQEAAGGDGGGMVRRLVGLGDLAEGVLGKMMILRGEEEEMRKQEEEEVDESINRRRDYDDGNGADAGGGLGGESGGGGGGGIDAMIVLDRKVDLVTPMVTPLTYEGLLDEVLGIDYGFIKVDPDVIDPPNAEEEEDEEQQDDNDDTQAKKGPIGLPLNDIDTLYAEVRDQHVEKFGSFLQGQAKALKESHSNFTNKDKDLTQIHQFVKQIPVFTKNLRSLTNHIHLAELVKQTTETTHFRQLWQTERSMIESETCYDVIEDWIASGEGQHGESSTSSSSSPLKVLRLICLQSLAGGGIKGSKFDSLRRDFVQTYGYEYIFLLHNLEKLGMIRKRETLWMETSSSSPFSTLRKLLRLIHPEVDTIEPDDISYVSSGYAPLSVRLIQKAVTTTKGGAGGVWNEEVLREIKAVFGSGGGASGVRLVDLCFGDHDDHEVVQDWKSLMRRKRKEDVPSLKAFARRRRRKDGSKPVLFVFYVGGITFMEIAALRLLGKQPSFPYRILIGTTGIVNGCTFLRSLA